MYTLWYSFMLLQILYLSHSAIHWFSNILQRRVIIAKNS